MHANIKEKILYIDNRVIKIVSFKTYNLPPQNLHIKKKKIMASSLHKEVQLLHYKNCYIIKIVILQKVPSSQLSKKCNLMI